MQRGSFASMETDVLRSYSHPLRGGERLGFLLDIEGDPQPLAIRVLSPDAAMHDKAFLRSGRRYEERTIVIVSHHENGLGPLGLCMLVMPVRSAKVL